MSKITLLVKRLLSPFIRKEREFIMHAAHELRTPMTIIKGFAEALEDITDMPPQQMKEIARKIAQSCGRLDQVMKGLLTLYDLDDTAHVTVRPCTISTLLASCQNVFQLLHPEATLVIEKNDAIQDIFADSDLLELALNNLLDNAVKYSSKQAKVHISLRKERNNVAFSVSDQGIGISPTQLERVFERFYCVDKARSRKLGGAGLGLAIVKTIAEKHRGKVTVTSTLGQGTTFTLVLPDAKGVEV